MIIGPLTSLQYLKYLPQLNNFFNNIYVYNISNMLFISYLTH